MFLAIINSLGHLHRFITYLYSNLVSPPHHFLYDPKKPMPAATKMFLFDDNSYLAMRLVLSTTLAATGSSTTGTYVAYADLQRRHEVVLAAVQQYVGKQPLHRRVRRGRDDYVVSVFEGGGGSSSSNTKAMTAPTSVSNDPTVANNGREDGLFVIMEIGRYGELTFYHDCLHCPDLKCGQCVEVMENVAAFGRKYTCSSGQL